MPRKIAHFRAYALALVFANIMACTTKQTYEPVRVDPQLTPSLSSGHHAQTLSRIAFGSCNKQYLPQPLWKYIAQAQPDLFIWTGDVVYADTTDMGKLSQIYGSQLAQPEYESFRRQGIPIIGVYDDHDYGSNDGDKTYTQKSPSMSLFLDFIGEASDSPRRKQAGVYSAYSFGPKAQSVEIILLDTRFNRDRPGRDADILGSEQWLWLETVLKKSEARLILLISSTQVLPFEQAFEKWALYPKSRERLITLLEAHAEKKFLLVSGDRHFGEISKLSGAKVDLWEVTSSGMTHSYRNPDEARNRNSLRQGPLATGLNYGWLEIDWSQPKARASIELRDISQRIVNRQSFEF